MRVFLGDLQPGMKVVHDVRSRDSVLLLTAGTVLTSKHIASLHKWEVSAVYVDMGFLPPAAFEPFVSLATRQNVVRELSDFLRRSEHSSHLCRTPAMEEAVVAIVDEVLRNRSSQFNLAEMRNYDEYLLSHSLGVCVLAVITGVNLGWQRDKLVQLRLAGLLHDVGKVKVPRAILLKPGPLNRREWREMRKHPIYALDILDEESCIMDAATQHHETMDGGGYPYGLREEAIGEFARVIAIADVYDAMTADRVYRRAVPVHEVLEIVYASGGPRFDPSVVRAFVRGIVAYPVGSVVELNDRSVAVVTGSRPGLPLYPRVRVLQEPDGRLARSVREIELGGPCLVARTLDPKESFSLSRRIKRAE